TCRRTTSGGSASPRNQHPTGGSVLGREHMLAGNSHPVKINFSKSNYSGKFSFMFMPDNIFQIV
ncbi:hypothetical protein, partial [Escherichia coli]|uniref:hypothetical protein n=1 Tax=Escherichia coli TaxID=562 RepID=UPI002FEE8981